MSITLSIQGTRGSTGALARRSTVLLFLSITAATLTIALAYPFLAWGYELSVFLLSLAWAYHDVRWSRPAQWSVVMLSFAVISATGPVQWAAATTVYGYATGNAALRFAGMGATAWVARRALAETRLRGAFLHGFAWVGFAVGVLGVLTYFPSPGRVLWLFPSPYPDVWGPFLSRNDFAGLLELSLPVALWFSLRGEGRHAMSLWVPACMLAAGIASASRAGGGLLLAEVIVVACRLRLPRSWLKFVILAAVLMVISGAGNLFRRFTEGDPLEYRREIAASAVQMVTARPWLGFGLGTFPYVYPSYTTFDAGATVEHAHNDWLEWASEGGIPFALAWLVVAAACLRPALRSVWGIGVLAAFLHAGVDYPFARFGLMAWTCALIGALGAVEVREVNPRVH